jgi:hypothetical protein
MNERKHSFSVKRNEVQRMKGNRNILTRLNNHRIHKLVSCTKIVFLGGGVNLRLFGGGDLNVKL